MLLELILRFGFTAANTLRSGMFGCLMEARLCWMVCSHLALHICRLTTQQIQELRNNMHVCCKRETTLQKNNTSHVWFLYV